MAISPHLNADAVLRISHRFIDGIGEQLVITLHGHLISRGEGGVDFLLGGRMDGPHRP